MDALIAAGAALVGAIIGFLSSVITSERTSRAAAEREIMARAETRQQQRDDFQRQTLLDLQPAMTKYVRSVGKIYVHDTQNFKQHGKFFLLGSELDQESYVTQVELQQLAERVRDDELRKLLEEVVTAGIRLTLPLSIKQVESAMSRFRDAVSAADTHLGTVLRQFM